MTDPRTIARLAEMHEFKELRRHFDELFKKETDRLAQKSLKNPEEFDRLEWERLRARFAGVNQVLQLPSEAQDVLRKESQ